MTPRDVETLDFLEALAVGGLLRVHRSNAEFARPMLRALPDAAIDRRTEAGL